VPIPIIANDQKITEMSYEESSWWQNQAEFLNLADKQKSKDGMV
jgi:hypothetical protein